MDKKNLEGKVDKVKGKIKEIGGVTTEDRDLEAEGKADRLKGNVKEGLGNLRQGIKEKLDELDVQHGIEQVARGDEMAVAVAEQLPGSRRHELHQPAGADA